MNNKISKRHAIKIPLLLFLIILLGVSLRIYKLSSHNLWYDEAVSMRIVKSCLSSTLQPPLYYALLHFWTRGFGASEFALRFLSVVFGILSIYGIYKLGSLFVDKKTGLISAFIISISPIHVWYAQEVREYTILPCLIMAVVYFFVRALKEDRSWLWIGFVISAILSLYIDYFTLFIILTSSIFFLFRTYRPPTRKWLISYLAIIALFSPWLTFFIKHLLWVKGAFWINKPGLQSIQFTFENFVLGYNATISSYFLSSILFTFLFILGILRYRHYKQDLSFLLLFLFTPIAGSFLISQWMPIYLDRQNMAVSPFYYIIIACGLAGINIKSLSKQILWAGVVILPALSLYNYYTDFMPLGYNNSHSRGTCPKKDFKQVTDYLGSKLRKGDIIAHTSPSSIAPIWYYFQCSDPVGSYYFVLYSEENNYWRKELRLREEQEKQKGIIPPAVIDLTQDIKKYNFKRVWLISSSWLRTGKLEPNSSEVKGWMEKNYRKLGSKDFDGLFVELYEE
jgi:mannosyltransferase